MVTIEQLNAVDPAAADCVAVIRAMLDEQSVMDRQLIAKRGHYGIVVSQINAITENDDDRHVFIETVFRIEGGSAKKMTTAQCNVILRWLGGGTAQKWVPKIVTAALKAAGQTELPGLTEQARQETLAGNVGDPDAEMEQINQQLKGETNVSEKAPAPPAPEVKPEPTEQIEIPKHIKIDGLGEISPEVLEVFLEHRRAVAAMMPEAPASANVTIGWRGWNIMLTLRDVDETALWFRTTRMLGGLNKLNAYPVNRYGDRITVTNNSTQPQAPARPSAAPAPSASPPTPPATSAPTPPAPTSGPPPAPAAPKVDSGEYVRVPAVKLSAEVTNNGAPVFKIKGGRMMKSGVTCWPEIAETLAEYLGGWNPVTEMTIGQELDITGYSLVALCEPPAAGKKWPGKVVEFVKA